MFKNKHKASQKGFSLVEVLIAVAILATVAVTLSMSLVANSQLNTKSKNTSTASSLSTTVIEAMQSLDLSELLTEINGFNSNEYGADLKYSMVQKAFNNYSIENAYEAINENGLYKQVTTQDTLAEGTPESHSTSSIRYRNVGDEKKVYFVGHENGKYAAVFSDVHNDKASFDIVFDIEKSRDYKIEKIYAMDQSNVVNFKERDTDDNTAASKFAEENSMYCALNQNVTHKKTKSEILDSMTKKYIITLQRDFSTEAVSIVIDCEYTIPQDWVGKNKNTYTINIGKYSTNSISEFAAGVYLFYRPLDQQAGAETRTSFEINNKNELSTSVYLIAVGDRFETEGFEDKYHPNLTVNELSNSVYEKTARTTVCSNTPDDKWGTKTVNPIKENGITIKDLANESTDQALFDVTVRIYSHNTSSFNSDGEFTPNDKYLLAEVGGSFLDNSQKTDLESDLTTGLADTSKVATLTKVGGLTYNGTAQTGAIGNNIDWTSDSVNVATNAGNYTAKARPKDGYTWSDGTRGIRSVTWVIHRLNMPASALVVHNRTYNHQKQTGVSAEKYNVTGEDMVVLSGTISAINANTYTAYASPTNNFAWEDGTINKKTITWKINPVELNVVWKTGTNYDTWTYDGKVHSASLTLNGVLSGDTCNANLEDHTIRDVGTKTAKITGLSNKNYVISTSSQTTHTITVVSQNEAYVTMVAGNKVTYNGQIQSGVTGHNGVTLSGTVTNDSVGTYEVTATLKAGYKWKDGSTAPTKTFTWRIEKCPTIITWGKHEWEYDGNEHSAEYTIKNANTNEILTNIGAVVSNNKITDAGTQQATLTSYTNGNYALPSTGKSVTLTVRKCPTATYGFSNFTYDGKAHFGVWVKNAHMNNTTVVTAQTAANTYVTKVVPDKNYCWATHPCETDSTITKGTQDSQEITVTWRISHLNDAWVKPVNYTFSGRDCIGYEGEHIELVSGTVNATAINTYTATFKPEGNHMWADNNGTENRTITWKIEEITMLPPTTIKTELEYNGQSQSPTFSMNLINVNASSTQFDTMGGNNFVSSGTKSAINAGTYKVSLALKDGVYWYDAEHQSRTRDAKEYTWKIMPMPITVKTTDITATHQHDAKVEGTVGNVSVTQTKNASLPIPNRDQYTVNSFTYYKGGAKLSGAPVDAGTYTYEANISIKVKADSSDSINNYTITKSKGTITISPRDLKDATVSVTGAYTYNGAAQTPTFSVKMGSYTLGKDTDYTVSLTNNTNAGTATITITGKGNYTGTKTATFTIQRAKTASYALHDRVYNGKEQTGIDSLVGVVLRNPEMAKGTDAGTYATKITPDDNHAWSDGTVGAKDISWEITGATMTVTSSGVDCVYDAKSHSITVTVKDITGYTVEYKVGNGSWTTTNPSYTNVCDVTVEYRVSKDNYLTVTGSKKVVITPLKTASYTLNEVTYDGSAHDGMSLTNAQRSGGSVISQTNAGEYTTKIKPNDNYAWTDGTTGEKSVKWTISKATLSITAANQSYVYNGSAQGTAISVTTKGSQTASITYCIDQNGTYTSTIPQLTNAGGPTTYYYKVTAPNHIDTSGSYTITMKKQSVALTTTPSAKTGLEENGSQQSLVNAGACESGGTVEYKVGSSGTWQTAVPTASTAGSYTVYYRINPDANHTTSVTGTASVSVSISAAGITVGDYIMLDSAHAYHHDNVDSALACKTANHQARHYNENYGSEHPYAKVRNIYYKNASTTVSTAYLGNEDYVLKLQGFRDTLSAAKNGSGILWCYDEDKEYVNCKWINTFYKK